MTSQLFHLCSKCGMKLETAGLCPVCLKKHDRNVNLVVLVVWVLALISLIAYFYIYINDGMGLLSL